MKRLFPIFVTLTIVLFLPIDSAISEISDFFDFSYDVNTIALATANVNFRTGPSTNDDSLDIIRKNTVIQVFDIQDNWAKVLYQGQYGFVCLDYLKLKNIDDANVLGIYTTFFSTHQKGRVKNIQKAVELLYESVVEPNKTFSLLNTIGPINKSAGYFEAPEFKRTSQGTETVIGYGGGVCQVATTLYRSICEAMNASDIEIKERHTHSKPVSYIEKGLDATISWNAKQDLKFKNRNNYPLMIISFVKDDSITCIIMQI